MKKRSSGRNPEGKEGQTRSKQQMNIINNKNQVEYIAKIQWQIFGEYEKKNKKWLLGEKKPRENQKGRVGREDVLRPKKTKWNTSQKSSDKFSGNTKRKTKNDF